MSATDNTDKTDKFDVSYMGKEYTFTRKEALATIWRHAHDDYRGKENGVKTILTYRQGTVSVDLESLTDNEIKHKLTASMRMELERRAKRRGAV